MSGVVYTCLALSVDAWTQKPPVGHLSAGWSGCEQLDVKRITILRRGAPLGVFSFHHCTQAFPLCSGLLASPIHVVGPVLSRPLFGCIPCVRLSSFCAFSVLWDGWVGQAAWWVGFASWRGASTVEPKGAWE